MRIISQDGCVDLNYALFCVSVSNKGEILAECNDNIYKVAKYSNKYVALDALKLMRAAYEIGTRVFKLPEEEEIPFK